MHPPKVLLGLAELQLGEKAVLELELVEKAVLKEELKQMVKKVPSFFFW